MQRGTRAAAAGLLLLCLSSALATDCPSNCNLPQCPCNSPQVDGSDYTRPPGCVAAAQLDPTGATVCRLPDALYPEPSQYAPQQIHVQPADASFSSIFVVWATGFVIDLIPELPTNTTYGAGKNASTPTDALSYVWYSTTSSAVAAGSVAPMIVDPTLANQVYVSMDNQYQSPIFHTVNIGPLAPSTTFFYKVGDPTKADGVSVVFNFTTPPSAAAGSANLYPFRLGAIADVGQTYNSSTTLSHLQQDAVQVVLLAGDLSYADDYQEDNRVGYQPRWDVWGRFTQSIFSTIPLITLIGNHEEESELIYGDDLTHLTACIYPGQSPPTPGATGGSGGDCARSWLHRYPTPYFAAAAPAAYDSPFWFSVDVGPAHIIALSVYNPSCPVHPTTTLSCVAMPFFGDQQAAAQYQWLLNDLTNVFNRTATPWLLVSFHEPYYSSAGNYAQATYFQLNLEPLFYQYGVDVVFTGHVHAYERSYPVYNNTVDQCAPIYFVVGDSGNEEGLSSYSGPDPVWSAYRESSFGHGVLDFQNASTAIWAWQRNQDPSIATTADTVTITRATGANGCTNRPVAVV